MRLTQVRGGGFLSFEDSFVQDLDNQGLVLVIGENGAGKSALLIESILWALFGETIREKVNPSEWKADDVINHKAPKKGCFVEVEFGVGGKTYKVLRARKHHTHGSGVSLMCGDENLSGEGIRETTEKIEKLVGMNFEAFTHSAIFAQGAKRFTQCTDAERRAILEEFQQTTIFTEARKVTAQRHLAAKQELATLNEKVAMHEGVIEELAKQLRDAEDKKIDRVHYLEAAEKEQAAKIAETKTGIKKLAAEMATVAAEMKSLEEEVEKKKAVIMSPPDRQALNEQRVNIKSRLAVLARSIEEAEGAVRVCEKRLEHFKPGDECPECLRSMNGDETTAYKKIVAKALNDNKKLVVSRGKEKAKVEAELKTVENSISHDDAHREAYLERQRAWSQLERRHNKIESDAEILQERLKSLKNYAGVQRSKVEEIDEQIDTLAKNKKANEVELTRVSGAVSEKKHDVEMLDFWLKGFGTYGIKEFMFRQALGFINERLTYFADKITGGTIRVQLDINDKGKIELVVDVLNGAKKYLGASGGQEKRVDLCISLALQSLVEAGSQKCNVAVFDEFDGALDGPGLYMFIEFLKQEAQKKGSVFVITHNTDLKTQFENILKIENNEGASKIEE